jgi:hypothetical protein
MEERHVQCQLYMKLDNKEKDWFLKTDESFRELSHLVKPIRKKKK